MTILNSLDFYKLTMSQFQLKHHPDLSVELTLKNRDNDKINIDWRELGYKLNETWFTYSDLEKLRGIGCSKDWVYALENAQRPYVFVDDQHVSVRGPWWLATLFETVIMSEITEAYNGGERVLELPEWFKDSIWFMNESVQTNFFDFGTRRRFSLATHRQVIEYLIEHAYGFAGTSNVGLALEYELPMIGTHAHEMFMVYAGLYKDNMRQSQYKLLSEWVAMFPSLNTMLTDTFGTEQFLMDLPNELLDKYIAFRQDSGDPFAYGDMLIGFLIGRGINPKTKTIVFSDGLDVGTMGRLHRKFSNRIGIKFGWGTGLTNPYNERKLNIVVKPTKLFVGTEQRGLVKLSDTPGKESGSTSNVNYYRKVFA